MIAKNLAYQALLRGHTARFAAASDMLCPFGTGAWISRSCSLPS
jgi:hypothetical protein